MFVPRVAPLGDHTLPALTACSLPWLWIGEPSNPLQRGKEDERIEHRSALIALGYIATPAAVLRQPVPREQTDLTALAKRQEPNAVEFALENPFRPSEALLC